MFKNTDDSLILVKPVSGRFITSKIRDVDTNIKHGVNIRSRLVDLFDRSAMLYYSGSQHAYYITLGEQNIKAEKFSFYNWNFNPKLKANYICGLFNSNFIVVGAGYAIRDTYPSQNTSINVVQMQSAENIILEQNLKVQKVFDLEGIRNVVQLENGKIMIFSLSVFDGYKVSVLDWNVS